MLFTSELANQHVWKSLFTCVVYTKNNIILLKKCEWAIHFLKIKTFGMPFLISYITFFFNYMLFFLNLFLKFFIIITFTLLTNSTLYISSSLLLISYWRTLCKVKKKYNIQHTQKSKNPSHSLQPKNTFISWNQIISSPLQTPKLNQHWIRRKNKNCVYLIC